MKPRISRVTSLAGAVLLAAAFGPVVPAPASAKIYNKVTEKTCPANVGSCYAKVYKVAKKRADQIRHASCYIVSESGNPVYQVRIYNDKSNASDVAEFLIPVKTGEPGGKQSFVARGDLGLLAEASDTLYVSIAAGAEILSMNCLLVGESAKK